MPDPDSVQIDSTDGVRLAVHELGGDGPVLLLAHATGFHGRVWEPLVSHLVDSFRCVSIDFRGHGDSSVPDSGSFAWSGFADDVEAVLDHLGRPSPCYAVGHSKGGAALLLAEQRRPGTFAGLYLFEPIVLSPEARESATRVAGEHPLAVGALRRREVFASKDEALANYRAKPPLDALHPDALSAYVDHGFEDLDDGTVRLKCRGADEAQVYSMSGGHLAFEELGRVACPTIVAAGALAAGAPSGFAEPIAAGLPAGTLHRDDALGHFGPLEDPELVAGRIRRAFSA